MLRIDPDHPGRGLNHLLASTLVDAVLLTGGLATGKTSAAIHVGSLLEEAGITGAVVDLDWLCWAWSPGVDVHALLCANLRAVVPQFRDAGVQRLVLARALVGLDDVAALRDALGPDVPLQVVRLAVDRAEAERRLRARDTGTVLDEHMGELASFEELVAAAAGDVPVIDTTNRDPLDVARDVMAITG